MTIYILIRDCTRVGAFPRAGPSLIKFGTREGGREAGRGGEGREGRGGEGRGGEGRGGQGRAGEGRGLSTLSTNQNLCDRGA